MNDSDPQPAIVAEAVTIRPTPWGLWPTLGFSLLIAAAFFVAQSVVAAMFILPEVMRKGGADLQQIQDDAEHNGTLLAVATIASAIVACSLIWLFCWLRKGMSVADYLGMRPPTRRAAVAATIAIVLLIGGTDLLSWSLGRPIVPDVMVRIYENCVFPPLLWVAVIVAAPAFEEMFFRGFLFRGLEESSVGPWGTILLTTTVWTLVHLQYGAYELAVVFALGVVLGITRWQTQSLVLVLVLHGACNLVATIQTVAVLAGE